MLPKELKLYCHCFCNALKFLSFSNQYFCLHIIRSYRYGLTSNEAQALSEVQDFYVPLDTMWFFSCDIGYLNETMESAESMKQSILAGYHQYTYMHGFDFAAGIDSTEP